MRAPLRGGKSKEWGRPPEAPLQPCAGLTAALTAMGVPRPRTKPLRGIGALFRRCAIPEKSVHFDIWRTCVTVELIDLHTEFPMAMEKLSPLHRPKLEIADIFRAQGHAWRLANAGHVSLSQLKVMSAIEVCRTEALGEHVAGCIECGHHHIAYNNRSCRRLKSAGQRHSAGMWQGASSVATITSPTTVARTGTAPSVRDQPHAIGWKRGPRTYCR